MASRIDSTVKDVVKLDIKDKRILALLSDNSRMAFTQLAKKAQISRDSVDYKIQRLQKEGVIEKFIPIVDLKRFGYYTYHVFMTVITKDTERKELFIKFLMDHSHTKSVMEYSDRWDLEWVMIARDIIEFDMVLSDVAREFSDVIHDKDKLQIVKGFKSLYLPGKFYESIKHEPMITEKQKEMDPDEKDVLILNILSGNARASAHEIGRTISISSDAVNYRIKKMVQAGVIRQYSSLCNLSKMGYSWHTLCLRTKTFDEREEAKLRALVENHPHIIRAVKVFGDWDIMLTVISEELRTFHKTVKEVSKAFSEVINTHQMWVAYKEYECRVIPKVMLP